MNGAFFDLETGVIRDFAGGPDLVWLEANVPTGMGVHVFEGARPDPLRYRVQAGVLVEYQPDRPDDTEDVVHMWDVDAWRWRKTPSLSARQATLCKRIEDERNRRSYLPITFEGAVFQADAESRWLIFGTLSRILRGDGLPAPWIGWRDTADSMHWADLTADAVRVMLSGLSTAIEDRESALRVATWRKKSAVRSLADLASIETYSVDDGWPT